ncbi:MAG: zinc ribbon domain-containing protein [Gemmatimonadota bacterium]
MTGTTCPACGAPASGRYCNNCGAQLGAVPCPGCGTPREAGTRFCPNCGRPAGPVAGSTGAAAGMRTPSVPWIVAGAAALIAVAALAWGVGNNGGGGASAAPAASPPDISALSPRERFDRLFNRVMAAAENGDSGEVRRFLPMARMAYDQLPALDPDARYHMAMLHLQGGEAAAALAQADTIGRTAPKHLFAPLIREAEAVKRGDAAAAAAARQAFLAAYDAEIALERPEYGDHRGALERFRGASAAP